MLGNDPNMALLMLHGLGWWEAGRSTGGMEPRRKGRVRVGEQGGETSSSRRSSNSSSYSTSNGEMTRPAKTLNPPPRPPRNLGSPATSRVAR